MPTPLTHALIPLALGHTVTDRKLPLRFWLLAVFCSVLPDADVIGFRFGVSYGDFFGHRGFFHSLFFAFLLSSTVMLLAFRKPAIFSKKWWLIWLFFLGVSSSHGILDAFTNGGLGIALLSPFNTTRYFSPWRPFVVAPFRIRELFTPWGKEVLLSELYWIWLPLILALIIAKAYRKIKLMNHNKTRKAECQSVELAKNIFKRLFVVLLIILLIAGIFFQAPWKVIALLLIILAACTVLPKPARKWFWLSVAAIVIVLIIWVFLPEDNEGWRPYTFDEELAAIEAARAVPDSENAATIYDELLKGYDGERFVFPDLSSVEIEDANIIEYMELFKKAKPKNTFYPDFWDEELEDLTISKPWSSKDYPELVKWLKEKHESTIEKLMQASLKRRCQFPINVDMVNTQHIDRYMAMVDWVHLLIRAANNDRGDGRIDQAVEKYTSVLKMNNLILQDSSDITMGIGISFRIMRPLKRFVISGEITNEHLNILEEALKGIKYDWTWNCPRIIEYEKLKMKNIIALFYEVNPQGRTRLSRDTSANPLQVQFNIDRPQTYIRKKLAKAGTILGWFFVPSTPQKATKIVDTAFKPLYEMVEPDFDWGGSPKEFSFNPMKVKFNWIFLTRIIADMMASMLEESCYMIHDLYLRSIAEQRGAGVIIALRRYRNEKGQWPEKLDDIKPMAPAEIFVDPINGGSFVYKLTEEDFTLYSKGKNNIDENGQYNSIWDPNSFVHRIEEDDRLIWPPSSSKSKKEKANAEQQ